MSLDRTERQSTEDHKLAQELSQQRTKPPAQVPGYDPRVFIGSGAYGEVWRGIDRNTGREVAIKFYTHRGGLDWSLLSGEVEKLRFLSADRYVVQLLDVGWDSNPPYYVMEYVENGSLDDLLQQYGRLPVEAAVELFSELAVGLVHAHGKGVLHCDLKPANVLLDQDNKPRLADFGQSRLSDDQTPALGTLFYMAPEQADLEAVPDVCWDVYALGAILYCMLTGAPPHRSQRVLQELDERLDLNERLEHYRQTIRNAPLLVEHRSVPGIDRALIEIIDRCLAIDLETRFANVPALINTLRARSEARARRPLVMLGFVGPILILAMMILFAWRGYDQAISNYKSAVQETTLQHNRTAAINVAANVSNEIESYFRRVEQLASDPVFVRELAGVVVEDKDLSKILERLSDPQISPGEQEELIAIFENHEKRKVLQDRMEDLIKDQQPHAASWFVTSPEGTHVAAAFDTDSRPVVGKNYAYRTYFHGGEDDVQDHALRPPQIPRIRTTQLSTTLESTATDEYKVAISTPVLLGDQLIGLMAMSIEIGRLVQFVGSSEDHFAVLVEGRGAAFKGVILQHPLYDEVLEELNKLPPQFKSKEYRVKLDDWESPQLSDYVDPLGQYEPNGQAYRRPWLASGAPVTFGSMMGGQPYRRGPIAPGLLVLIQQDQAAGITPITDLTSDLLHLGALALSLFLVVVGSSYYFVVRGFWQQNQGSMVKNGELSVLTSFSSMTTRRITEKNQE
jgi:hypothetical protein